MMFLKKTGKKIFIKLHKELYDRNVIERVKRQEPGILGVVHSDAAHYLVEMRTKQRRDYLDFLNYLIYMARA
ncbi:MAG: hypothetical protein ABH865_03215 [Candidatus Omnitrophota bacterium]